MAKDKPTDVFMQFAAVTSVWPGVTTVLTHAEINTGLSVRGGLMWLIHLVECYLTAGGLTRDAVVALSTVGGLAAMPRLSDKGCIAKFVQGLVVVTSGIDHVLGPAPLHYLPPVPLAAPKLHMYCQTNFDDAALDGDEVTVRLGFTTAPLDAKSYAEIAETWSYT